MLSYYTRKPELRAHIVRAPRPGSSRIPIPQAPSELIDITLLISPDDPFHNEKNRLNDLYTLLTQNQVIYYQENLQFARRKKAIFDAGMRVYWESINKLNEQTEHAADKGLESVRESRAIFNDTMDAVHETLTQSFLACEPTAANTASSSASGALVEPECIKKLRTQAKKVGHWKPGRQLAGLLFALAGIAISILAPMLGILSLTSAVGGCMLFFSGLPSGHSQALEELADKAEALNLQNKK